VNGASYARVVLGVVRFQTLHVRDLMGLEIVLLKAELRVIAPVWLFVIV
jgi:hypothetical protein